MSAPPLPEVFGNYALKDFSEVVPPESISWLPQTAGWLWLGLGLLGVMLHFAWRALKHWYRNRYRREAIRRLQALTALEEPCELVAEINRILKITALVAYSRETVAKLSGDNWASFLNRQCERPPFNIAQLELLATAAYSGQVIGSQQHLLLASVQWVEQHQQLNSGNEGHA
jgi:hypothetical protein